VWNRQQDQDSQSESTDTGLPVESPAARPAPTRQTAVLGPSITINGTLAGDEDLVVEGRVDGEISFPKHTVTVSTSGKIKADMKCKNIFVDGQVRGNLYGEEVVVIRASGKVNGNAVAPRVSLEDGCHFHGSIDMQPKAQAEKANRPASPTKSPTIPRTTGAKPDNTTPAASAPQQA